MANFLALDRLKKNQGITLNAAQKGLFGGGGGAGRNNNNKNAKAAPNKIKRNQIPILKNNLFPMIEYTLPNNRVPWRQQVLNSSRRHTRKTTQSLQSQNAANRNKHTNRVIRARTEALKFLGNNRSNFTANQLKKRVNSYLNNALKSGASYNDISGVTTQLKMSLEFGWQNAMNAAYKEKKEKELRARQEEEQKAHRDAWNKRTRGQKAKNWIMRRKFQELTF